MIEAFSKLRRFHRGFEKADAVLQQTIGRPTCISGCGRCCTTTTCMIIEAMDAVSILMGLGKLQKAVSIAEGWLLERHSEALSYDGMLAGCFASPKIRGEFAALSALPCPFLSEARQCVIYEARPMGCHAYGVTRSSMGLCPRAPGKGETLSQFTYAQAPGLKADIQRFREGLRSNHRDWVTFGFFPTLLYRAAKENEFRAMVRDNRIATAKIIGTEVDQNLMWQPQVEAVQKGVASDLVADMA